MGLARAESELDRLGSPIPAEKLENEWRQIRERMDYAVSKINLQWNDGEINQHLDNIFSYLKSTNRIRYYDKGVESLLGAKKHSCHQGQEGSSIYAFYIPNDNTVFISPDFDESKGITFGQALLHEVIHAYQYTVRFPQDVSQLYKLTQKSCGKQKCIEEKDIVTYLNLIYETQANWYVLSLRQNKVWMSYIKRQRHKELAANVLMFVTHGVILKEIMLGLLRPSNKYILNQKDAKKFHEAWPEFGAEEAWDDAVLGTHELIMQNIIFTSDSGSLKGPTSRIQAHYAKRLMKNYYCRELDFTFDPRFLDQRNYTDVHNNYFRKIGDVELLQNPACKDLIYNALVSDAPMQYWLNTTESMRGSCASYQDIDPKALEFYKSQIEGTSNAFKIFPGTCGTKGCGDGFAPGILALPQIPIQP